MALTVVQMSKSDKLTPSAWLKVNFSTFAYLLFNENDGEYYYGVGIGIQDQDEAVVGKKYVLFTFDGEQSNPQINGNDVVLSTTEAKDVLKLLSRKQRQVEDDDDAENGLKELYRKLMKWAKSNVK